MLFLNKFYAIIPFILFLFSNRIFECHLESFKIPNIDFPIYATRTNKFILDIKQTVKVWKPLAANKYFIYFLILMINYSNGSICVRNSYLWIIYPQHMINIIFLALNVLKCMLKSPGLVFIFLILSTNLLDGFKLWIE